MSKPKEDTNIEIPIKELIDFLTDSEIRMLKNRWRISRLLQEGNSVRSIAEQVRVGTDTVVRVSKMIFFQKKTKKIKTSTPWIFGKSEQ